MGANILSPASILTRIEQFMTAKYPAIDASTGTDLYDLIFYGNAQTAGNIFEEIGNVEKLQSIFTTFGEDLDLVARNYNLIRKRPTFASGFVTLFTTSFASDIFIPDNSTISTVGTINLTGIPFSTIGDNTMLFNEKEFYFNSEKGRYEITVPITCLTSGIDGNQGTSQISLIQSAISQIDGCTNYSPTTGGRDGETDLELQERCALSWVVSAIGTRDGYRKLLLDQDITVDAYAVGPFDTDSVRQGVDIYCITSSPLSDSTQALLYSNDDYTILTDQPAVDIVSIKNNTLSPIHILREAVSYTFNKQVDNPFAGSDQATSTTARLDWISPWNSVVQNIGSPLNTFTMPNSGSPAPITIVTADVYKNARITFTSGANNGYERTVINSSYDTDANTATFITNDFPYSINLDDTFTLTPRPNINDDIEISTLYNPDIHTLQTYIDQSERNVVGANIVIKNGHMGQFYLTMTLTIFPQYDNSTVITKVENAIIQYMTTLKLGNDIQLSDLTVVAQTGQGTDYTIIEVDHVDIETDISLTYIYRWDGITEAFDSSGIISVENREYAILSGLTVN